MSSNTAAEEFATLVEELDLDVDMDEDEIEELDMSDKSLKTLPICVCSLKDLTGLYLENNNLTNLPHEIGMLENLTELYLTDIINYYDTSLIFRNRRWIFKN